MIINIKRYSYFAFLLCYLSYILASTYYVKEAFPGIYFSKFLSFFLITILSTALVLSRMLRNITHFKIYWLLPALVLMPLLLNFSRYHTLITFQYLGFFVGMVSLSYMWRLKKLNIPILFLFAALPLIIDTTLNSSSFTYNTYYGRARLLLGYFHPKEAGISLMVVILIINFYHKKFVWLLNILFLILLFFVQSRNSFLYFGLFVFANFCFKYLSHKVILSGFLACFASMIALFAIFFDLFNVLTSGRLKYWLLNMNLGLLGSSQKLEGFETYGTLSKYHVDNFYLEYLNETGLIGFSLLLFFLFFLYMKLAKTKIHNVYINALILPFIFFCFFDAGMFSIGNFLNIFVMSIVFHGVVHKKYIQNNALKATTTENAENSI